MTDPPPIGLSAPPAAPSPAPVRAAIARAAAATGIDFDYLLAQARLESGLDPSARASTSSATGLYQFTAGTWLETVDRHGARHGLGWADAAISGGRVSDPDTRARIMALRFDPDASATMAAELAGDNRVQLAASLGREPDAAELYLAHFLGSGGAVKFLTALQTAPDGNAAALFPQAAAANRAIFFTSGAPRTLAGVMTVIRDKVAGAMEQGRADGFLPAMASPVAAPAQWRVSGDGGGNEAVLRPGAGDLPAVSALVRDSFGSASGKGMAGAPPFVRAAYARLQRFGL